MIENNKQLRLPATVNGLLLGAVLTALSIFSFYFMTSMVASVAVISAGPLLFGVILPIAAAVLLCFDLRKKIGGYWNMRQAATGIFIMFFAAFIMQFLCRDLLFAKVIEPNMVQKTETAMINTVSGYLKQNKAKQEDIDKKMAEIKQQFDSQKTVTAGQQIQSVGITIIFLFVLAIIFAAFFKREGHVYYTDTDNSPAV